MRKKFPGEVPPPAVLKENPCARRFAEEELQRTKTGW